MKLFLIQMSPLFCNILFLNSNYVLLNLISKYSQYIKIQYTNSIQPITVAARSKAWTVFARSNTGIVGSNPTQRMDVCLRLFCVYV
jgi:hypothetical protein